MVEFDVFAQTDALVECSERAGCPPVGASGEGHEGGAPSILMLATRSVDPDRTYRLAAATAWTAGDPDQIRQVVDNLLANARRHTPPGTHVAVTVAASSGQVEIVVADDGPGVPADDLPHVFDRFWRQDKARSRTTGGSGLGLVIAASIVQLHHGSIRAEATPGGGLTSRTALPLAAADLVQKRREPVS